MNTPSIKRLKRFFRARHERRGYFDFVKICLGTLVSLIVLAIFLYDALERFELTTFDYRMRLRKKRAIDERVVLIDMGEDSIEKIGRWPWPREWHATMISVLSRFGARAVAFDVIFSEEAGSFSDTAMEEAMAKAGNVFIPYAAELGSYDEKRGVWNIRNIILPLERFSRWAKGEGHITIVPDLDGTIRKVPIIVERGDTTYPQLGLTVAADVAGLGLKEYKKIRTPFGRHIRMNDAKGRALYMPVDKRNQLIVNWAGKWEDTFTHYSYIEIITSYQNMLEGKKPLINLTDLEGKICIIGLTAAGLYDIKSNAIEPTYPAVGTNANIINNVLNRDFITKAPRWLDGIIIIILGLLLSVNISRVNPVRGASIMILMIITYSLISFAVLDILNVWIAFIYPFATIIFAYLIITFYNQIVISIERTRLLMLATKDGLTGLYVIRHFNLLLEAEINRAKTTEGRLSILMSDIDHFKKINDAYGHQVGDVILKEIANIVMACCRQLDVPSRYGGEEFIVMLPGADEKDATAVAERIRKTVENYNFKMGDKIYKATISLGVATHKTEKTREEFVREADAALYKAKEEGRNRVCVA